MHRSRGWRDVLRHAVLTPILGLGLVLAGVVGAGCEKKGDPRATAGGDTSTPLAKTAAPTADAGWSAAKDGGPGAGGGEGFRFKGRLESADADGGAPGPGDGPVATAVAPGAPPPPPSAAPAGPGGIGGGGARGPALARRAEAAKHDGKPAAGADAAEEVGAIAPADPAAPAPRLVPKKGVRPPPPPRNDQSGLLTAGSFDDNQNFEWYRKFLRKLGSDQSGPDVPSRFHGRRITVNVRNGEGAPVGGARVVLTAPAGNSVTAVSRNDGRAIFVTAWDGMPGDAELTASAVLGRSDQPVAVKIKPDESEAAITLAGAPASPPKTADICLIIDTTGSMGDEMQYLKNEIRGISEDIKRRFPDVQQRFSLVVYKDTGDEYVTKSFDFNPNLDEFKTELDKHFAGGGGDFPEALDQGLEAANKLEWVSGRNTRIAFLIADAPPHANNTEKAVRAATELRKRGVAVYPIACSGYDPACEFVMRATALLTGGQFLFLTDDSGVGNAHAEPHIPCYHVQKLNVLMMRAIAQEIAGTRIQPKAEEIIRTVGKPGPNGEAPDINAKPAAPGQTTPENPGTTAPVVELKPETRVITPDGTVESPRRLPAPTPAPAPAPSPDGR